MNREARAELVRLGMLELQAVRGRLSKVTTEDVAGLLDLVDTAEAAADGHALNPDHLETADLLGPSIDTETRHLREQEARR